MPGEDAAVHVGVVALVPTLRYAVHDLSRNFESCGETGRKRG